MSDSPTFEGSPYQSPIEPAKQAAGDFTDVRSLFHPLYRRRIWARIIGIVFMLVGILYSLTIIGALVGVPLAFAGYYLIQSASMLEQGFAGQLGALQEAANKLSQAMMLIGILILIWVTFMVLYFLFIFFVLGVSFLAS